MDVSIFVMNEDVARFKKESDLEDCFPVSEENSKIDCVEVTPSGCLISTKGSATIDLTWDEFIDIFTKGCEHAIKYLDEEIEEKTEQREMLVKMRKAGAQK